MNGTDTRALRQGWSAAKPAIVDAEVLPDGPTQLLQALRKGRQTAMSFRIICSEWREHTDPPHLLALLRACRERPRDNATFGWEMSL